MPMTGILEDDAAMQYDVANVNKANGILLSIIKFTSPRFGGPATGTGPLRSRGRW